MIMSEGKFLGRFKLVDAGIVAGFILLVLFGVKSYHLLTTPQAPVPWKLNESMEVYCIFDRLDEKTAAQMKEADADLDPTGRKVAEILRIDPPKASSLRANLGSNLNLSVASAFPLVQRSALLRLQGDTRGDGKFYYKGAPATEGATILFENPRYRLEGILQPGPEWEVFVLVRGGNVTQELAELLKAGDPLYDRQGRVAGKILEGQITIGEPDSAQPFAVTLEYQKSFQLLFAQRFQQVKFWLQLKCFGEYPYLVYDGEPLRVGRVLNIRSNLYDFVGLVSQISTSAPAPTLSASPQQVTRYVRLKTRHVPVELAKEISPGDQFYGSGKLATGKIFRVIDSPLSIPQEKLSVAQERSLEGFLRVSPYPEESVSVRLWAEIDCVSNGEQLFFGEASVKLGGSLALRTNRYDLEGTILEILEIPPPLPPQKLNAPNVPDVPDVVVHLLAERVWEPVAKSVNPEDPILNSFDVKVGKIVSVEHLGPADVYRFSWASSGPLLLRQPDLKRLKIVTQLHSSDEKLKIGQTVTLRSERYELEAMVTEIQEGPEG